jgi:glycosyltransferase involved in cell wall biosynthesis
MPRALFVSFQGFLQNAKGGAQVCTNEYIDVIRAAGIDLTVLPFGLDRRPITRALRQLNSSPYFRAFEPSLPSTVAGLVQQTPFDFVFLNQVSLATLASRIRPLLPEKCKIVVLSHGLESTDLLHFLRLRGQFPLRGRVRPTAASLLGSVLLAEAEVRTHVDIVCTLSPFDEDLEKWMGTRHAAWLPRVVKSNPLPWRPFGRRLGFVGTLDHSPNLEGLVAVLEALGERELAPFNVRVIGGPSEVGAWLAARYACVDYLGAIDDTALAHEAATWSAFLNPIFCQARGCSTKLAMALGWEIPIVTTPQGRRGYVWGKGELAEARTPHEFASLCMGLFDDEKAREAQEAVRLVTSTSPGVASVAQQLRGIVGLEQER